MVDNQCKECDKLFKTWPAWIRKGGGKFCSKTCSYVWASKNRIGILHPAYREKKKIICLTCALLFIPHNKRSKYCSYKCKGKIIRGTKHGRYKDKVGYSGVHAWLYFNYDYANKCENIYCRKRSRVYEWCLIKGFVYDRKRENFWQLCKSCHMIYDRKYYPVSATPIPNYPI